MLCSSACCCCLRCCQLLQLLPFAVACSLFLTCLLLSFIPPLQPPRRDAQGGAAAGGAGPRLQDVPARAGALAQGRGLGCSSLAGHGARLARSLTLTMHPPSTSHPSSPPNPEQLTEEETEYKVVCVRHVLEAHVVLQFHCTNTVSEQVLEDVSVSVDLADAVSAMKGRGGCGWEGGWQHACRESWWRPGGQRGCPRSCWPASVAATAHVPSPLSPLPHPKQEDFTEEAVLPLPVMPQEGAGQTYVVLGRAPGAMAPGVMPTTLRFRIKEVDPSTGEGRGLCGWAVWLGCGERCGSAVGARWGRRGSAVACRVRCWFEQPRLCFRPLSQPCAPLLSAPS